MLRRSFKPPLVCQLGFGSDLEARQVEAFLAAVSGLSRSRVVELDITADEDRITHLLRGEASVVEGLRVQLEGLIPGTTVVPAAPAAVATAWSVAARVGWSGGHPLLRSDAAAEAAAALLASAGALGRGERLLVRLTLRPASPAPLPQPGEQPHGVLARLLFGPPPDTHVLSQLRSRQAGPLLRASLLVAVASSSEGRASHLLARVIAVLRARRGGRGSLGVRPIRRAGIERSLTRPARGGSVFSPAELVSLTGWPIGTPPLAGLTVGIAPLRPPARRIPTSGRVLARSTWPAAKGRLLAQPIEGAVSHSVVAGPSGVGKSELLAGLCLADIREGRGVLVVDGKGDLAEALLARIPAERVDDVIVLDPAAAGPVTGLRVFGRRNDPELAADVVLGVLRDVFRDSWGIRSEAWLRAGLTAVAHDRQGTLGDLGFLFSDDRYRRSLVGGLRDPMLQATFAAFDAMSPGEKANQLGAPLTKLNELLGRRVVRTVLSQPEPKLDLHEVLARRRIVIASLSPGRLGSPAARLLGALLIHALFNAVQARSTLPQAQRSPFLVYVDEPRVLVDLPVPLDGLFELARGLGVGLTISAQSLTQLPTTIRNAALTNARSLVVFQQSADDADLLARELPGITAEQLQHLGQYEIVTRIALGPGDAAAPATGRTLPLPAATIDPRLVRQRSSELYGRDPAEVDQALAARHEHGKPNSSAGTSDAPIGRTRRKA